MNGDDRAQTATPFPVDMPRTDFTAEYWRVHDSAGCDHGVYADEQDARAAALALSSNRQDTAVRILITKTIYQSVALHRQRKAS